MKRVLVADDEESLRIVLRVNLPLAGWEVVEARDTETAFARAREQEFDLFLLDVMMPPTSTSSSLVSGAVGSRCTGTQGECVLP